MLLDKAFPKLSRFSIGFWIRLRKHENESVSTIMSYKHGRKGEVFRLFVNNSANHSLGFAVWRASFRTNIQLGHLEWSHVFWTWESKSKAGITLGDPAARGGAASLFLIIFISHIEQYFGLDTTPHPPSGLFADIYLKHDANLKAFPHKDNGDKFYRIAS